MRRLRYKNDMSVDAAQNPLALDPRSVAELVRASLRDNEHAAWDAVGALHWRGTREVLNAARNLCRSDDPFRRARGADILGQLGIPDRTFPNECFASLSDLLAESDDRVLFSVILALQHLDRIRAAPLVLPFMHHVNDNIRYAVAVALGSIESEDAIEALLALMMDRDGEVRNWATFGLGQQSDADSPTIRTALANRLDDRDEDVRYEAICGLGRRGDDRAIPFLKTLLHDDPDDIFAREAAAKLVGLEVGHDSSTSDLLGVLQRRQRWIRRFR